MAADDRLPQNSDIAFEKPHLFDEPILPKDVMEDGESRVELASHEESGDDEKDKKKDPRLPAKIVPAENAKPIKKSKK